MSEKDILYFADYLDQTIEFERFVDGSTGRKHVAVGHTLEYSRTPVSLDQLKIVVDWLEKWER